MRKQFLFYVVALVGLWTALLAQRRQTRIVATIENDPMYEVLPPDAIPAIRNPEFISGKEAENQMMEKEAVMGLVIDGEARAYSLWQLDAHEIVDDSLAGVAFAVTW